MAPTAMPGKARCGMKASGRNSALRWAAATRTFSIRALQVCEPLTDENDAFNQWNLGAALSWQQFGLGVVYTKDNGGLHHDGDNRTWVAGIDYTTGPFKLGASYLNNHEGLGDDNGGRRHQQRQAGYAALGSGCGLHLRPGHDLPRFGGLGPHDAPGR